MKLNEIQQKLKAPKNQFNKFGGYKYRNCEDILEALKPLLGDAIVTISDEIVQVGDRFYVKATATFIEKQDDGRILVQIMTTAYARESFDKKGMDSAQITGAASSYARKYALNGLFLIDDTNDADTQDNTDSHKPVRYEVKRNIPAADDEEGGSSLKQETVQAELDESRKQQIKEMLRDTLHKPVNKAVVKELTGLDMAPANYEAIIKKLNEVIDNTDPLTIAMSD